jgi:hypothetical protein
MNQTNSFAPYLIGKCRSTHKCLWNSPTFCVLNSGKNIKKRQKGPAKREEDENVKSQNHKNTNGAFRNNADYCTRWGGPKKEQSAARTKTGSGGETGPCCYACPCGR